MFRWAVARCRAILPSALATEPKPRPSSDSSEEGFGLSTDVLRDIVGDADASKAEGTRSELQDARAQLHRYRNGTVVRAKNYCRGIFRLDLVVKGSPPLQIHGSQTARYIHNQ
jgi:hypothetical protein